MNKVKKNSTKHLILLIVAISIAGMILWPLFDFIYSAIFTHSGFNYSATEYIIKPISFGIVLGLTLWLIGKKQDK